MERYVSAGCTNDRISLDMVIWESQGSLGSNMNCVDLPGSAECSIRAVRTFSKTVNVPGSGIIRNTAPQNWHMPDFRCDEYVIKDVGPTRDGSMSMWSS